jgi:sterol desaturase/sphingolipid hydroxylase (fatty acid hydroxylase superfamily)
MAFEDLMPILMIGTFVLFLILEAVRPARPQAKVRFWLLKGIAFYLVIAAINAVVPAIAIEAIGDQSLFHLQALGAFGGAAITILASDIFCYWAHRGLHSFQPVWRWTHQLHHSAERMDMAGCAFFHPLDVLAQQVAPTIVVAAIFGVTPMAAGVAGLAGYLLGISPHLNVKTPVWLGYVFQRPEMHAVHHLRGVHAYNYGVLAFSDLLFGTWKNPAEFPQGEFGFWDGASSKVGAMLIGRDVAFTASRGSAETT